MKIGAGAVLATVALIASGAVAWLIVRKGSSAVAAVGTVANSINPTNPNNVAARAVNAVVQTVTGDQNASLGTKLWEWFNPGAVAREATLTAPTPLRAPVIVRASDLAATIDADDAAAGSYMRQFEYFNATDAEDAALGAAMTAAQGPALGYRLNVGRRK